MASVPNVFAAAGEDFDRCAERRDDAEWLAAEIQAPSSRILLLDHSGQAVVQADRSQLQWFAAASLQTLIDSQVPLFLGQAAGISYFSVSGPRLAEDLLWSASGSQRMGLREAGVRLPAFEASLFAYAKAIQQWQADTRYCAQCAAPLRVQASGHRLACSREDCGKLHFPRTDAAIIVIVDYQGSCLLGRQAHWEPGRYSTLAGFVEPGESLEDAVRREVAEEAGVRVGPVEYHSSQPWPMPASLMLGFNAVALSPHIELRDDELEDARWFSPQRLLDELAAGKLHLPSPVSISYRLIADWLRRHTGLQLDRLPGAR
ncbi:NAD(+) diphosphatase [Frateuria aurantia]